MKKETNISIGGATFILFALLVVLVVGFGKYVEDKQAAARAAENVDKSKHFEDADSVAFETKPYKFK